MSLLCIAYDFSLNDDETALTESITTAAYFAWCLVNDYFSFDKEWQNYEANDRKGEITSSVFLYMKWYGIDSKEAKRRMRTEIVAREQYYVDLKASLAARGAVTPTIERWFTILDVVTAGNHAWSMTTARYHHGVNDPYRLLRTAQREAARSEIGTRPRINGGSMNDIARSWHRMNSLIDDLVWTPKTEAPRTAMVVNGDAKSAYAPNTNGHLGLPSAVESGYEGDAVGAEALSKMQGPSLESFSEVITHQFGLEDKANHSSTDRSRTQFLHRVAAFERSKELCPGCARSVVSSPRQILRRYSRDRRPSAQCIAHVCQPPRPIFRSGANPTLQD